MDKQIKVYPWNGIILCNKKQWTIDISNSKDTSLNNYDEWNNVDKKGVFTVWVHLYKILFKIQINLWCQKAD